jgi:hypothetical protein
MEGMKGKNTKTDTKLEKSHTECKNKREMKFIRATHVDYKGIK